MLTVRTCCSTSEEEDMARLQVAAKPRSLKSHRDKRGKMRCRLVLTVSDIDVMSPPLMSHSDNKGFNVPAV